VIFLGRINDLNPRQAASIILSNYISHRNNLNKIITRQLEKSGYSPRDRRFVYEIVKGTVRYLIKIDYLITLFSKIKIEKIDEEVLNTLRTAVYQLMFMSRVPGYSIVDESVKIVKNYAGRPASGFANALLRRISSIENLSWFTDEKIDKNIGDFNRMLSLKYSFPLWMIDYWADVYGKKDIERLVTSLNKPSQNFIRINALKTSKKDQVRLLIKNGMKPGEDFEELSGCKDHEEIFADTIVIKSLQDIENIPGYSSGFFSIQDFSSQFAVKSILNPQPGEKILDLCGAPGGKATYMAELTGDNCEVLSVDIDADRTKIFKKNIDRLGIKNIRIIRSDITEKNFIDHINCFDKIFIDCPCSALGTIQKNPDVKYNKTIGDLKRLSRQSLDILLNCSKYLKPAGRIVFYTCTLSRIENQDVIERFVKEHEDIFEIRMIRLQEQIASYLHGSNVDLSTKNNFQEIMPYYFDSEGGFVAEIYRKK
jgi:16S rRNA (cytosine967-C5)-methyltransferase